MTPETIKEHADSCEKRKVELLTRGFTGPWGKEPHRVNWKAHGLDCMIVRNANFFNLCGYVGVKKGHRFYGKPYGEAHDSEDIRVHGGLTYSGACSDHICHVQESGDDDTWWLGFDCNHSSDLAPGLRLHDRFPFRAEHEEYRDLEYVKIETEHLASQLAGEKSVA